MSDGEPVASRPVPVPDEASQPFFDAAARGELLIKHCAVCNRYLAPQSEFCDRCLTSAIEWRTASGRGTVYSFIINHQVGHPGFASIAPYNVIVVELEEGPRLNSNYLGPNEELAVDMPVRVVFEPVGGVVVPTWVRA
jgi:uncharacterized OB-fold protein